MRTACSPASSDWPCAADSRTGSSRTRRRRRGRRTSPPGNTGGDCVEAAPPHRCRPVRDSKDPSGPVVTVGADAWQAFVGGLRRVP
ncbi:DUF397 domain-containing protein [Streptomyces sp. NPDC044984]|uniref:DUF397 domain-containing protein n=1 Tax=Streptomyces sp. NPDC044984 TaxID=3154335 RepID=UPI00340A1113